LKDLNIDKDNIMIATSEAELIEGLEFTKPPIVFEVTVEE